MVLNPKLIPRGAQTPTFTEGKNETTNSPTVASTEEGVILGKYFFLKNSVAKCRIYVLPHEKSLCNT